MINLWFLFIGLEVYRNWYIIEKKKSKPDYLQSFILRGMAAILHGVFLDVQNTAEWVPILAFQLCSFWVLFDLFLNFVRGKEIFHIGTANWIDKYLGKSDMYWVFKVFAATTAAIILILLQ